MDDIPVIDIAPLVNGSPTQAEAVAKALGTACRDVGFFYITGHIRSRRHDTPACLPCQPRFLPAPPRSARRHPSAAPADNRGYIRLGGETLDPSKPADVKEAFNIGLELAPDDPELLARAPFRSAKQWPDLPGFRDTMLDYCQSSLAIGLRPASRFCARSWT